MNATKPSKSFQVNDSEIQAHCTTQSIRVQDADGSVLIQSIAMDKACTAQSLLLHHHLEAKSTPLFFLPAHSTIKKSLLCTNVLLHAWGLESKHLSESCPASTASCLFPRAPKFSYMNLLASPLCFQGPE